MPILRPHRLLVSPALPVVAPVVGLGVVRMAVDSAVLAIVALVVAREMMR